MTDAALVHLAQIKTLENLSLHWAEAITDDGIVCLKQLPSLKKLDIKNSKVTDKGLSHIYQIKSLEYLELPNKGISDEGLVYLGELKNLRYLSIARIHYVDPIMDKGYYTDKGVAELAKLQLLEGLNIGSIGITDSGMDHIAKLTNLRDLNLFGCTNVTNKGLTKLTTLKSLQRLYVNDANLTIGGLSYLNKLSNLVTLRLDGVLQDNSRLDISRLTKLETFLFQLKKRRVGKKTVSDLLNDSDLICLAKLTNLEDLQVSKTGITDDGLKYLAGLTNLTRLGIGGEKITDKGLIQLSRMNKLNQLILAGNFTDEALLNLERLPTLHRLTIMEGANFRPAAVQRFRRNMPDLVIFQPNMRTTMQQQTQQRPAPIPLK